MVTPCGSCMACRINRAREWTVRICKEAQFYDNVSFFTLTYDDNNIPDNGSLCVRDVQLFHKRLRKAGFKFRYYLCGEYGSKTLRPHYHAIYFGLSWRDEEAVHKAWQKGYVMGKPFVPATARYVAKYVVKKQYGAVGREYYKILGVLPEFSLCSRNPPIGGVYFTEEKVNELNQKDGSLRFGTGFVGIPRTFRRKYIAEDDEYAKERAFKAFEEKQESERRYLQERISLNDEESATKDAFGYQIYLWRLERDRRFQSKEDERAMKNNEKERDLK